MRATELLCSTVVDETGQPIGRVHDIRANRQPPTAGQHPPLQVAGLAIGGGVLAHAWGFAEGRATGPWLLRVLTQRAARRARFVPADRILDWGPGIVRIQGNGDDLPLLRTVAQP